MTVQIDWDERGGCGDRRVDEMIDVLSHYQRRILLSFLMESSVETVSLEESAEHVFERSVRHSREPLTRKQVKATLHHVHLPMLSDLGSIEYDARSRDIRYWGDRELETLFDRLRTASPEPASTR